MAESIEQVTARLKREEEEKERDFQRHLEEARAAQAPWRAEQEAKRRAEEQERRQLLEDARHEREQEMKTAARSSWLGAGGRAEEFEEEWPSVRKEMLRRRALETDASARAAQRRSGVSSL
jgi:hypothetical protein